MEYPCPYCNAFIQCYDIISLSNPNKIFYDCYCDNHEEKIEFGIMYYNPEIEEINLSLYSLTIWLDKSSYLSVIYDIESVAPASPSLIISEFNKTFNTQELKVSFDWLNLTPDQMIKKFKTLGPFL